MTTIYKYRIRCTTDNTDEYSWGEEEPATCPTNTAHTIDTTRTTIVDKVELEDVNIKEETVPTGGHFSTTTISITALPNTTTSQSIEWPTNISALAMHFITEETHRGDVIHLGVAKDTTIGAAGAAIAPSTAWTSQNYTAGNSVSYNSKEYTCILDTVSNEVPTDTIYWKRGFAITASSTVFTYAKVGFFIKVYDGANADDLGRIISIDTDNSKLYMEHSSTNTFSPLTPTYIQMTVKTIQNYMLCTPGHHEIGGSKIGSSHVPADTPVTLDYINNSADTKTFVGTVEYLY